jgi:hypothetical protein
MGMDDLAEGTLRRYRRRVEYRFLADWQQPEELRRSNSLNYSIYNLDAWLYLARLGQHHDIEIWTHRNSLGAGPEQALQCLEKHAPDWPHPQLAAPPQDGVARLHRRVDALALP